MRRQARVEHPLTLRLEDGGTIALESGTCWIDEEGAHVLVTWTTDDGDRSARISHAELAQRLIRREFVYISW